MNESWLVDGGEVDPPSRAVHANGIDVFPFAESSHNYRKQMFVIVEEKGVDAESVVVGGFEVGEFWEEEAQEFEVEHFLAAVFGDAAD